MFHLCYSECSLKSALMLIPEEGLVQAGERYGASHGLLRALKGTGFAALIYKQIYCASLD
jgi:hypothetical protein